MDVGTIKVRLAFDESSVNSAFADMESKAKKFNSLLLTPTVDDRQLTALNKHFDLKLADYKKLESYFASNPLKPKVDQDSLKLATRQFERLRDVLKDIDRIQSKPAPSTRSPGVYNQSSKASNQAVQQNNTKLARDIGSEVGKAVRGSLISRIIGAPARAVASGIRAVGTGLVEGATFQVSQRAGKGLSESVEKALGGSIGSSELLASKLSDKFIAAIRGKLPKELTDELSASIKDAIGAQDVIIDQAVESSNRRKTSKQKKRAAQQELVDEGRDSLRSGRALRYDRDNLSSQVNEVSNRQENLGTKASSVENRSQDFQLTGKVPESFTKTVLPEIIESANRKNAELIEQLKAKEAAYTATIEDINKTISETSDPKILSGLEELKALSNKDIENVQARLKEIVQTVPTDSFDIAQSYSNYLSEISTEIYSSLAQLNEVEQQLNEQISEIDKRIKENTGKFKNTKQSQGLIADEQTPAQYDEIFESVAGKGKEDLKPKLFVADAALKQLGGKAAYSAEGNLILITSQIKELMERGQLNEEQIQTLAHELEHGMQSNFGSMEGLRANERNKSLREFVQPTMAELKEVSPFISRYDEKDQELELDAEVRGKRKAREIVKKQSAREASKQAIAQFGAGGEKVEAVANVALSSAIDDISRIKTLANNSGVEVESYYQELSEAIVSLSSRVSNGVELISTIQLGQGSLDILSSVSQAIEKQFNDLELLLSKIDEFKTDTFELINSSKKEPSSSNLAIADPSQENSSIVSRAGSAITRGASSALSTVSEGASDLAVNRINNQLSRVPGQRNTIDISAKQINSLGELEFKDALKLATLGLVDLASLIHGVTKGGVRTIQGVEEGFLGALPGGKAAKAIGQELVLPAVFIAAVQKVPILAEITQTLVTSLQSMSMPFVEAGSQMIGAAGGEGVAGLLSNAGFVGEKLASPLGGATSTALTALAESAGELAVQFGSVVVTGKAFGKALEMATPDSVKNVFADDRSNQKALPQGAQNLGKGVAELVYSEVSKKVAQLGQQAKSIQYLKPAESIEIAQKALKNVNQALPKAESELKALPSADRTGTRISSDYGNLTKAKKYLEDLIEETKKLLSSPVEAIENMVKSLQNSDEQIDSSSYVAQMKTARKLFAEKAKEFSKTGDTDLGAEIESEAVRARSAIAELEKSLGSNVDKKLKDAIAATRSALTKSENAVKTSASNDEGDLRLRIQNPQSPDEKIANAKESVQKYEGAINAANLKQTLAENNQQVQQATNDIKSYQEQIEAILKPGTLQFDDNGVLKLKESMDGLIGSIPGLGDVTGFFENLKTLGAGVAAFAFLSTFQDQLIEFGQASFDAALQYESFTTLLNNTSSSSGAVAASLDTINSTVARLNVNLAAARDGYVKLQASSLGTELEGRPTDKIFGAVSQASSVYQLDEQQTERVYMAIQQMSSKGIISAEELRQQLGESLPSAFQIAARSMGLTTKEFNKLLETGQIASDDFLPKFAAQLSSETSQGVAGAANSAQGSMNKLNNAILRLQETAGKPLLDAYRIGLGLITPVIEYLPGVLTLTAASVALLGGQLLWMAAKPVLSAIAGMLKLATSTTTVAGAMRVLMMQALKFGLWAGGATLALGGLQTAFSMLFDSGGKFGEWAKSSKQDLLDIQNAAAKARGEINGLGTVTDKNLKNDGFMQDTIIGSIFGKDLTNAGEKFIQKNSGLQNLIPGVGLYNLGQSIATGGKSDDAKAGRTSANIKAENMAIQASEDIQAKNAILSSNITQFQTAKEVGRLNREIEQKQLESKGFEMANPLETTAIREQKEEIDKLITARDKVNEPLAIQTQKNQSVIDTATAAIKELKENMAAGKITTAQFESGLANYTSILKAGERDQKLFNDALDDSNKQFTNAGIAIAKTIAQLEDYMSQTDFNKLTRDARISMQQLNGGLTEGQAEYTKQLSDQVVLLQNIATKQQAIKKIKDEVGETNINQVLSAFGLKRETVGQSQLEAAKAQATTPQQKVSLDAMSQILTLETDLASMTGQYYDSANQLKQQITDTNKSIADYFKQALESFEDTKNAIAESNISALATRTGNAIKRSVLKFQQSFATELVDSIVAMLEISSRFLTNQLKEQTSIQSAMREWQQSQQQGNELGQGLVNGISAIGGGAGQQIDTPTAYNAAPLIVKSGGRPIKSLGQVNDHHDYQTSKDGKGRMVVDIVLEDSTGKQRGVGVPSPVSGTAMRRSEGAKKGYGNFIDILDDKGKLIARMAHLDSFVAKNNQRVNAGDIIGTQGNTGRSTGTHLHIEAPKAALEPYIKMLATGKGTQMSVPTYNRLDGSVGRRDRSSNAPQSTYRGGAIGGIAAKDVQEFARKTIQVANELGIKPEHLFGIMGAESSFKPREVNRSTNATGLLQIIPDTARGLGTTTEKIINMSPVQQLDVIKKFFQDFINRGTDFSKLGVRGAYGAVFRGDPNASLGVRDNATSLGATIKRAETNYGAQINQFMKAAGTVTQAQAQTAGYVQQLTSQMPGIPGRTTPSTAQPQAAPNTDFNALAGVGANQLAQAQSIASQQAQAKIADARNQKILADENDTLAMDQERAKFKNVVKDARRQMADDATRQVREQEDFISGLGYGTPSKELQSQIREINRNAEDSTKELTRGLEDLIGQREVLKIGIENIKKNPSLDVNGEISKGLNLALGDVNKSIESTRAGLTVASSNRNKAIQDAIMKANDAEKKRVEAFNGQMNELSSQSLNAMADAAQKVLDINPDDYSKGDPIDFRITAQQKDLQAAYSAELSAMQDMVKNGERTAEEASNYYTARKELLDKDIANANEQSRIEKQAAIEARDARARERVERLRETLANNEARNFEFNQELNTLSSEGTNNQINSLRNSARNTPMSYSIDTASVMERDLKIAETINNTQAKLRELTLEQRKNQDRLSEIGRLTAIANKSPEQISQLQQLQVEQGSARSADQIQRLIDLTQQLDAQSLDGIRKEFDNVVSDRAKERLNNMIEIESNVFTSGQELLGAKSSYASTIGFGVNAQKYQKEAAINQQGFDFSAGLRGIEEFAEKTGASADTVAALKANLESLNEIKLKGIEAEFNPFTQVLGEVQQGFASTIAGVITGSQSLSEGLNNMLGSIAESLANLAAQWITNELFSSLFGMGGLGGGGQFAGGGGATSSAIGTIFSGLIGGFADGGEVQSDPGINALRSLPGSIGKALTKEGSNSVLAALTPGERVLTISEARLYNALHPTGIANSTKMPQISNFATGGMVGVSQGSYTNMASNTVNVPVTVNGTDASDIDKVALSNAVRVAVISELATQSRPNGMLNKRR